MSISLAAESTEEVEDHGTKEFSTQTSSLSLTFEIFCYTQFFFQKYPRVISMLWKKLNKENKTPSRRTELCNTMVSRLFQNIRIREKIECFFIWNLLLKSSRYSVRTPENMDQKNYEYGHFLRSVTENFFLGNETDILVLTKMHEDGTTANQQLCNKVVAEELMWTGSHRKYWFWLELVNMVQLFPKNTS